MPEPTTNIPLGLRHRLDLRVDERLTVPFVSAAFTGFADLPPVADTQTRPYADWDPSGARDSDARARLAALQRDLRSRLSEACVRDQPALVSAWPDPVAVDALVAWVVSRQWAIIEGRIEEREARTRVQRVSEAQRAFESNGFFMLATSDDEGAHWSKPRLVVDPSDPPGEPTRRALVGNVWTDPLGRLWLFFDQSQGYFDGRCGDWYTRCDNPEDDEPKWTKPVRFADGCTLNKPTVMANGFSTITCLPASSAASA